jgi:hypothetical protein
MHSQPGPSLRQVGVVPLDRRLGGQGASLKAVTNVCPCRESNPRFFGHPARSPSAIQTELFPGSNIGGGRYKF